MTALAIWFGLAFVIALIVGATASRELPPVEWKFPLEKDRH